MQGSGRASADAAHGNLPFRQARQHDDDAVAASDPALQQIGAVENRLMAKVKRRSPLSSHRIRASRARSRLHRWRAPKEIRRHLPGEAPMASA
jgi:hypothetical protein